MRADERGVSASQRTSSALSITEATAVSVQGRGIPHMPEIPTKLRVEGWRKLVDAVHAEGAVTGGHRTRTICLMALYQSHPSAIPIIGKACMPDFSFSDYQTPHALRIEELPSIVESFGRRHSMEWTRTSA
jgi:N-ethylmaleimide reductase